MIHNGLDNIGQIIKQIRVSKKLKREKLAEAAGISPRYLAKIENEGSIPSYQVIYMMARALGLSADEFVYPERNAPTSAKQELINMLHQCDEADILVALATVRALRYRETYLANTAEVVDE